MIIGIDGHDLEGNRTGVGRYLANILAAWDRSGVLGNDRVIIFFKDTVPDDVPARYGKRLLPPVFGKRSTAMFVHVLLPRAARREGINALWCPGYVAPLVLPKSVALVLTLHDIIYEARPELFNWQSPADRFLLKYVSRRAAERAARILVPSHFTEREVLAYYDVSPERIVVTPEAADASFRPLGAFPERSEVPTPYLFFVGSLFSRRHIPECIEAFRRIAPDFPDLHFLIAGANRTRPFVDIAALAAEANASLKRDAIILLPYASPDDLPDLYRGAIATAWLSDYEGFGLPPLESLACGTPVITTARGALPETVGDCALFVEHPEDVGEIAAAMRTILTDETLRAKLAACGPTRASAFRWDLCGEQTLAAIREAVTIGAGKKRP